MQCWKISGNSGTMPEKRSYPGEYRRIRDRQGIEFGRVLDNPRQKGQYPSEYREEIVYRRVPKNGRIQVSTGEWQISGEYQRKVWASTGERSERVPEKGSSKYWRRNIIRASTGEYEIGGGSNSGKYRRKVQTSIRKGSGLVPRKGYNPGEYQRRV